MANAKRSPKQVAALKKMQAGAKRARAAKKAASKPAAPRKATAAKKAPRKSAALARPAQRAAVAVASPKPKTKYKAKAKAAAGKAMKLGSELLGDVIIPAGIGGGAASVVDVVYGAVAKYLPAQLTTNSAARHGVKALVGIGAAWGAQKLGVPAKHCKAAAVGVCTVGLHRVINEQVEKRVQLNLAGVGMTVGDLASVLPPDEGMNGLEALGALASGGANLGAVLPFITNRAA